MITVQKLNTLTRKYEPHEIEAITSEEFPGLAVHRSIDIGGVFTVTHLQSGGSLAAVFRNSEAGHPLTEYQAIQAAKAFAPLCDWGLTIEEITTRELFDACISEWDDLNGHFEVVEDGPTMAQLQDWSMDGDCEATDGCRCDPDGYCEHGKPSWLLKLGMI